MTSASPCARAVAFPQKPGPRGRGAGQVPMPGAASCRVDSRRGRGAREGLVGAGMEEEEEEEEGLRPPGGAPRSAGAHRALRPQMPGRRWKDAWPRQMDGQTDASRAAPLLPALGAAGARPVPEHGRARWLHRAVADASEVVPESRGCRSSPGLPKAAWGWSRSARQKKIIIETLKSQGLGFMGTRCRRGAGSSCWERRHRGEQGSPAGTTLALQLKEKGEPGGRRRKGRPSSPGAHGERLGAGEPNQGGVWGQGKPGSPSSGDAASVKRGLPPRAP